MGAMPLSSRLLAVAERLREEADGIKQGEAVACTTCKCASYTADATARYKLKRNLAEVADKLQRLSVDASKIGLE